VKVKTVKRGSARTFLDYEDSSHKYLIRPGKVSEKHAGTHRVQFILEDSQLGDLSYNVRFKVNCTVPENITTRFIGVEMEQFPFEVDPPLPIVKSMSQFGVALIEFTKTMLPRNASNVTNGTVWINETEYPALGVQVLSSDLDLTPQEALSFTW